MNCTASSGDRRDFPLSLGANGPVRP
uniref:Uncharacterized protein n=1 Tax=Anguilla anguilla TaxID=7936 RepID=A0A0E9UIF1_ANGAN